MAFQNLALDALELGTEHKAIKYLKEAIRACMNMNHLHARQIASSNLIQTFGEFALRQRDTSYLELAERFQPWVHHAICKLAFYVN